MFKEVVVALVVVLSLSACSDFGPRTDLNIGSSTSYGACIQNTSYIILKVTKGLGITPKYLPNGNVERCTAANDVDYDETCVDGVSYLYINYYPKMAIAPLFKDESTLKSCKE